MVKRTKAKRLRTVSFSTAELLRWVNDLEGDSLEMTGCGNPDDIDESREVIAVRVAVLKALIKRFGDVVFVRVDP